MQARSPRVTYFVANLVVVVGGRSSEETTTSACRSAIAYRTCPSAAATPAARRAACGALTAWRTCRRGPTPRPPSPKLAGGSPFTRLACQTRVHGDVIVERLIRSPAEATQMRAEESGLQRGREMSLVTLFCDLRGLHAADRALPPLRRGAPAQPPLRGRSASRSSTTTATSTCTSATRSWRITASTARRLHAAVSTRCARRCSCSRAWRTSTTRCWPSSASRCGSASAWTWARRSSGRSATAPNGSSPAIGDSVNRASRIESATKTYAAGLLVSDEVMEHVSACRGQSRGRSTLSSKGRPASLASTR